MADDRCDYCGSMDVTSWHMTGEYWTAICASPQCRQRDLFATHEPNFGILSTPVQRFAAQLADAILAPIAHVTAPWFVDKPHTLRGRISLWIYSLSYWLAEVAR